MAVHRSRETNGEWRMMTVVNNGIEHLDINSIAKGFGKISILHDDDDL